MNKEHKVPTNIDVDTTSCMVQAESGEVIMTRFTVSIDNLLNRKDLSSLKQDRTQSSFTTHSQLVVSRKFFLMQCGEVVCEKVSAPPRPLPKISFKGNWMKELGSQVAGGCEDSQQIHPKSRTQLSSTERFVSEQPSGLLTKDIEKMLSFGCESTNSRTGRLVM